MPSFLHGVEFGAGLAVGFFFVELALQETWYRWSIRKPNRKQAK